MRRISRRPVLRKYGCHTTSLGLRRRGSLLSRSQVERYERLVVPPGFRVCANSLSKIPDICEVAITKQPRHENHQISRPLPTSSHTLCVHQITSMDFLRDAASRYPAAIRSGHSCSSKALRQCGGLAAACRIPARTRGLLQLHR